jgi:hypothetical protein
LCHVTCSANVDLSSGPERLDRQLVPAQETKQKLGHNQNNSIAAVRAFETERMGRTKVASVLFGGLHVFHLI